MFTEQQATRIIELLESIDASLKRKNARLESAQARPTNDQANEYAEAIAVNLCALAGKRLTAAEVAKAIGKEYDGSNHHQRLAMGDALRQVGATRVRTGANRYYIIPI